MTMLKLLKEVEIKGRGAMKLYRRPGDALIDVLISNDGDHQVITIDRHPPEAESALLTSMDVVQQIQDDDVNANLKPGRLGPFGKLPPAGKPQPRRRTG